MAYWLFKEEPTHYNFADLEKNGTTLWTGVSNALARKHLRNVRRKDRILYYHTGKEKAVVGTMKAVSDAKPAPERADDKAVAVQVQVAHRLPYPVSLTRIKEDPLLADWDLIRLPRLSVVPVTEVQWRRVEELSRQGG